MKYPLVVGFGHRKGRGKDTLAAMVKRDFEGRLWQTAFAKPLKDAARLLFGLTELDVDCPMHKARINKFWLMTPREILQKMGSESFRHVFGGDFWVKVFLAQLQQRMAYKQSPEVVFVTDVRFPEEAKAIKKLGGVLVRVDRNLPKDEFDSHESETALKRYRGWDYIIDNNGTPEDLEKKAVALTKKLKKKLKG